jgi:hypothetical protein
MTKYVADGHGNWFEVAIGETDTIFIIDTDDLTPEQNAELIASFDADRTEDVIKEYGNEISIDEINGGFIAGVKHALADLKDVYGEGIEETDLWAEYGDN